MKKNGQNTTLFNTDLTRNTNKSLKIEKAKTTNINILLNRVRLDKKRNFIKKISFLSLLVLAITIITIITII